MKNVQHWLALCPTLISTWAWADHPLFSETADALAPGTCQVEWGRSQEKVREAPTVGTSDVQFSCGAGTQSQVAIGLTSSRAEGLRTESYRAVAKTTLIAPEDGATGFGLRYGASWSSGQNQGTELESVTLLAVASRELSNGLLVHANLGFTRDRLEAKSTGLWSLGIETTGAVSFAADVFGEERSKPSLSMGAGWRASKGTFVSAAYAMQTAGEKTKTLSIGLKLVF